MAVVLVSIISEHLIPNYHLFKHVKSKIDRHLLISTPKMMEDGVTANFTKFIEEDNYPVSNVITKNAWDFDQVLKDLKKDVITSNDDKYYVNLTGGTKMVSLAVFRFFQTFTAEMYYVAIGTNSCTPFYPNHKPVEKFKHSLSLNEYLGLYGYKSLFSNKLHKNADFTSKLFDRVKENKYNALNHSKIRKALIDKTCEREEDLTYYQGLWFEEYIYQLFKSKLKLSKDQIGLGVQVRKYKAEGNSDNEFDVMFIKNNKLYAIECKSSIGKRNEIGKNVEGFLYKLAAAVHDFGLQVNPILAVLGEIHNSKKITDRADILKIKTLDANKFDNELLFDFYLKSL